MQSDQNGSSPVVASRCYPGRPHRGELYLHHDHFGIDLKLDHAQDTLRHLNRIWTRPVHIETCVDCHAVARRSLRILTEDFGMRPEDLWWDPLVFPCATGDENYLGSARATIVSTSWISPVL